MDSPTLCTPIWLHKVTFLGFFLLFTILWATTILLLHSNIRMNGFPLVLTSNHYTWTFGPTIALTIIISLWRQVDYHCKLVQPWSQMLEGPVQPSTSLLLDYLSPSQLVSLRRAIQNRHFAVAESISGFIILKFVIMASTTLLIPSTVVDGTFPIIMDTKFDSARFVEGNAQGSVASGDATHSA